MVSQLVAQNTGLEAMKASLEATLEMERSRSTQLGTDLEASNVKVSELVLDLAVKERTVTDLEEEIKYNQGLLSSQVCDVIAPVMKKCILFSP